jgi:hypothetical protein
VHDRHVGIHETDVGALLDQSGAPHPTVKDLLMRCGDLLAAAHHRSVESDEQRVLAERRRVRLSVARAPRLEHSPVQRADRALVRAFLLVGSAVAVHGSEVAASGYFTLSDNSICRTSPRTI